MVDVKQKYSLSLHFPKAGPVCLLSLCNNILLCVSLHEHDDWNCVFLPSTAAHGDYRNIPRTNEQT